MLLKKKKHRWSINDNENNLIANKHIKKKIKDHEMILPYYNVIVDFIWNIEN